MSSPNYIFFITAPDLENLVSMILDVDIPSSNAIISPYHHRILKCRELIFSFPNLLATPELQKARQILVILPKRMFDSAEFQARLQKMSLRVFEVMEASNAVLQECFHYTVIAKMAPNWNTVGDILVQGRDFLAMDQPLNAIKMEVIVTNGEIHLSLHAFCIKMPVLKLAFYEQCFHYQEWIAEGDTTKPLTIPLSEECHVLPSLKQATILSLTNYIPTESCFKEYKDFKKHWKNMYGYRLPDLLLEDQWYCNIRFHVFRKSVYTYPLLCIRPFGIVEVPRIDLQASLCQFLSDFQRKMGYICGESCQLTDTKAAFPDTRFYSANQPIQDVTPRCGTTYNMPKSAVPYRQNFVKKPASQPTPSSRPYYTPKPLNISNLLAIKKDMTSHRKSEGPVVSLPHISQSLTKFKKTSPKKYVPFNKNLETPNSFGGHSQENKIFLSQGMQNIRTSSVINPQFNGKTSSYTQSNGNPQRYPLKEKKLFGLQSRECWSQAHISYQSSDLKRTPDFNSSNSSNSSSVNSISMTTLKRSKKLEESPFYPLQSLVEESQISPQVRQRSVSNNKLLEISQPDMLSSLPMNNKCHTSLISEKAATATPIGKTSYFTPSAKFQNQTPFGNWPINESPVMQVKRFESLKKTAPDQLLERRLTPSYKKQNDALLNEKISTYEKFSGLDKDDNDEDRHLSVETVIENSEFEKSKEHQPGHISLSNNLRYDEEVQRTPLRHTSVNRRHTKRQKLSSQSPLVSDLGEKSLLSGFTKEFPPKKPDKRSKNETPTKNVNVAITSPFSLYKSRLLNKQASSEYMTERLTPHDTIKCDVSLSQDPRKFFPDSQLLDEQMYDKLSDSNITTETPLVDISNTIPLNAKETNHPVGEKVLDSSTIHEQNDLLPCKCMASNECEVQHQSFNNSMKIMNVAEKVQNNESEMQQKFNLNLLSELPNDEQEHVSLIAQIKQKELQPQDLVLPSASVDVSCLSTSVILTSDESEVGPLNDMLKSSIYSSIKITEENSCLPNELGHQCVVRTPKQQTQSKTQTQTPYNENKNPLSNEPPADSNMLSSSSMSTSNQEYILSPYVRSEYSDVKQEDALIQRAFKEMKQVSPRAIDSMSNAKISDNLPKNSAIKKTLKNSTEQNSMSPNHNTTTIQKVNDICPSTSAKFVPSFFQKQKKVQAGGKENIVSSQNNRVIPQFFNKKKFADVNLSVDLKVNKGQSKKTVAKSSSSRKKNLKPSIQMDNVAETDSLTKVPDALLSVKVTRKETKTSNAKPKKKASKPTTKKANVQ